MKEIIKVAEGEIGYKEYPPNSNKTKYGEWFGLDGLPWCGIFVSWVYDQSGYPLGNIGYTKGFAGVYTALQYFKKKKWITDDPVPGDIVFFDWQGDGKFDHVGIYQEQRDDYTFYSIEGNTSMNNQSNGGEVMLRIRKYKNTIFVHPEIVFTDPRLNTVKV